MSSVSAVTLTYVVTVATSSTEAITNIATINSGDAPLLARTASVMVNPHHVFLPLLLRN